MDKTYDHENSEVLLCKLRRANNVEGSRGDGSGKSEGGQGKKKEAPCGVDGGAAGRTASAAGGVGDKAENHGSSGDAVSKSTEPAAAQEAAAEAAATAVDGLSLAGVALSPSLSSSAARESVDANGSDPKGGALLTTVTSGSPVR